MKRSLRVWPLVLAIILMSASCSKPKTTLTITDITDQNGTPLRGMIKIIVNGDEIMCFPGQPCLVSIDPSQLNNNIATVVGDVEGYTYSSPEEYVVEEGTDLRIPVVFFRPYTLSVLAVNEEEQPVSSVFVSVDGAEIGTTDEYGYFQWKIDAPIYQVADTIAISMRVPGSDLGAMTSIVIEDDQFVYDADVKLTDVPANLTLGPPMDSRGPSAEPMVESPSYSPPVVAPPTRSTSPPPVANTRSQRNRQTTPAPAAAPPPRSRPATDDVRFVTIRTTPPNALIRLVGRKSGETYSIRSGEQASVPPDFYSWEVEEAPEGYAADRSKSDLDLMSQNAEAVSFVLTPISVTSSLRAGLEAERAGRHGDALQYYQSIERPPSGSDNKAYIEAQNRIGVINLEQTRNMSGAVQAFQNVLEADSREYAAHFNLGLAHYQQNNYAAARKQMDAVVRLKPLIPVKDRVSTELKAMYYRALARHKEYANEMDPTSRLRLRNLAFSELSNFVSRASGASGMGDQLSDAQSKISEIKADGS